MIEGAAPGASARAGCCSRTLRLESTRASRSSVSTAPAMSGGSSVSGSCGCQATCRSPSAGPRGRLEDTASGLSCGTRPRSGEPSGAPSGPGAAPGSRARQSAGGASLTHAMEPSATSCCPASAPPRRSGSGSSASAPASAAGRIGPGKSSPAHRSSAARYSGGCTSAMASVRYTATKSMLGSSTAKCRSPRPTKAPLTPGRSHGKALSRICDAIRSVKRPVEAGLPLAAFLSASEKNTSHAAWASE
mmetsp:Transcript_43167/g.102432  ORF Transcript_43167/g.102432 Transcript_43167/m.102432 type:complete len:247 (+) Transcript_43167:467-1207(+)